MTLPTTLPAGATDADRDHHHRAASPAGLDAVMLEPLVSRLVLARRRPRHGAAAQRLDRVERTQVRVPGTRPGPGRGPTTAAGGWSPPRPARARTVTVTVPAGASPWSAADQPTPDHPRRHENEETCPHHARRTPSSRSGPFRPHEQNPILRPQGDGWESASVYNPAAVVKDGQVVLLYRAHADDIVSHVGLATSDDGIHFERHPEPVLSPTEDYERYGAEDPRVTEVDGTYYLTYTGWDRTTAQLCLATSTDLLTWTKHGPMFPDFNTFLPQGNGQDGPWSKAGGDPAGADRRPLPHVLRRGLDLLRLVRRPDPLDAVLQRRAADGAHRRRARSASSSSRSGRSRSSPTTG